MAFLHNLSLVIIVVASLLLPQPQLLDTMSPSPPPEIAIRTVRQDEPEMMSLCHSVRRRVFIEEQNVPPEIEMDDDDAAATHVLATRDGMAVGAARIVWVDDDAGDGDAGGDDGDGTSNCDTCNGNRQSGQDAKVKVGKIGRVCVLKSQRGRGYGRQIVLFAAEEIRRVVGGGSDTGSGSGGGTGIAKLGAQVHALKFYESMGFELLPGEEYMDAGGVPHRDMQRIL